MVTRNPHICMTISSRILAAEEVILRRLLALNLERAAQQGDA